MVPSDVPPALLLLADGRLPVGGHAHSAGIEAAVEDGRVVGPSSLEDYALGRLWTAGLVDAALAVAAGREVRAGRSLAPVDIEADARVVAPPLRAASRRLGRQLVRTASRAWPAPALAEVVELHPDGPHQSVATGAVVVAAGLEPEAAAALVVHHAIATPTQAAVKLLGLDPVEIAALAARLSGEASLVATAATAAAGGPLDELPAFTGPLVEIVSVEHHARPVRLFAT